MTQEVSRQVGNERVGGYAFKARFPYDVDASGLTDLQVMQQVLAHKAKTCICFKGLGA